MRLSAVARSRLLVTLAGLVAQFVFVAAGVYLGMRAEDWREQRSRREAARATLTNLRDELRRNHQLVTRVLPYHRELAESLLAVQARGVPVRNFGALQRAVGWRGFRPIGFRHAAWDLALADRSLGWIEPRVAFTLADVYASQASFARYQEETLYGVISPAGLRDEATPATAYTLSAFFSDAAKYMEPELLRGYERVLPRIDSALARLAR